VTAGYGQLTRVGAALLAAVALLAAAKQLPSSIRAQEDLIAGNAGVSRQEKELAPARSFGLDPSLVLFADERLPRDAVFSVVTGEGLASGHLAAGPFAAYWLLPRRHVDDPRRADWILSFGADPAQLGVDVEVVADLSGGLRLMRVRR
jgi:hypothetical protein